MRNLLERNTQLCVYFEGEKVVDLWGTAIGDSTFSPDSLVNAFSSGKSLESIAMASLVSQGLLDYGTHVTAYWPEFGAEGTRVVQPDLLVSAESRDEHERDRALRRARPHRGRLDGPRLLRRAHVAPRGRDAAAAGLPGGRESPHPDGARGGHRQGAERVRLLLNLC